MVVLMDLTDIRSSTDADYRQVIQGARVPLCSVDAKGRISMWNDGMSTLMGYSKEEVLGQLVYELVEEEAESRLLRQALDAVFVYGEEAWKESSALQLWMKAKNQVSWLFSIQVHPVVNSDGLALALNRI